MVAKDMIKDYLEDPPSIFEVNWRADDEDNWGSVQYSTAEETYKIYWKARETLTPDEVQEAFGITSVQLGSIEDARLGLIDNFEEIVALSYGDDVSEIQKVLLELNRFEDLKADRLFEILRDSSWDLWSAASFGQCMVNPAWSGGDAPLSTGSGPEWNVRLQEGNVEVGLICAMLVDFGFVESSECFKQKVIGGIAVGEVV